MDFERERVSLTGSGTTGFEIDQKIHTVKLGLNYRFNTGAVARAKQTTYPRSEYYCP